MPAIRALRNREKGRRAFIVANGPSVLDAPLERLAGEVVIGMNASTLLEESRGLRQTYYALGDLRFLTHPEKRQLATDRLSSHTLRVLRADLAAADDGPLRERTYLADVLGRDGFSRNLASGFYHGCTTALLAVQIAVWLGCREVFLLGVDLLYRPEQPRFYAEGATPQEEDVFTSVQVRNLAEAGRACREMGVALYGCSERSLMRPYLPFAPIETVLGV